MHPSATHVAEAGEMRWMRTRLENANGRSLQRGRLFCFKKLCYTIVVKFEIVDEIQEIEIIAIGSSIRDLAYLQKIYGQGRWRKLKGFAHVRLPNGNIRHVELHWYEAHGIGRKDIKIKRYLD